MNLVVVYEKNQQLSILLRRDRNTAHGNTEKSMRDSKSIGQSYKLSYLASIHHYINHLFRSKQLRRKPY